MTLVMWPVDAPISQMFGAFPNAYQPDGHTGIDFATPRGTPLRAPAAGVVLYANWAQGLGWPNPYWIAIDFDGPANGDQSAGIVLVIDHRPYGLPYISIMAHLDQTGLNPGDHVRVGELVGQTGNTGRSSGPHLHFEVLPDKWNVNAKWYGRIDPARMIGYSGVPNPEAPHLLGVDVASYQPGIDFNPLTADFAIVKITGGDWYVNPYGNAQYVSARAAGTRRGIYHFAAEGKPFNPDVEAQHFLTNARQYLDGNTLIALDYEPPGGQDAAGCLRWLQIVENSTGLKPWIYLNQSTASLTVWDPVIKNGNPLWVAQYATNTEPTYGYNTLSGVFAPDVRAPFSRWTKPVAWQFSSTARITGWGGGLDANVFYGGDSAWLTYCRPGGTGGAINPIMEDEMIILARRVDSTEIWAGNSVIRWHVPSARALNDMRWLGGNGWLNLAKGGEIAVIHELDAIGKDLDSLTAGIVEDIAELRSRVEALQVAGFTDAQIAKIAELISPAVAGELAKRLAD